MSRCFPYTSVIVKKGRTSGETPTEPIKLQKERLRNHDTEKHNHNKRKKESKSTSHKCVDVFHVRNIRFVKESSRARKFGSGDSSDGKKESDCLMRISKLKTPAKVSYLKNMASQIAPQAFALCPLAERVIRVKLPLSFFLRKEVTFLLDKLKKKRGSVIKIQFRSRKQTVPEILLAELPEVVVPSSVLNSHTSEGHCEVASTSGHSSLEPVVGASHSKALLLEPEMLYESLLEQCAPPPLNFEGNSSDELDWIFGSKQSDEKCLKRFISVDEGLLPLNSSSDFSWPPQATHLPEAEIYALPYVNLL